MKHFYLIRSRVIALVLIFAAAFFLLVQYQFEIKIKNLLYETEQTTYETLADTMVSIFSLNLAFDLNEENKLVINDYLAKTPELVSVVLLDRKGQVLYQRMKTQHGRHVINVAKTLLDPQNGASIGTVSFEFASDALQQAEKEHGAFVWRFFSVSVIVLMLLVWMLDRAFSPLDRLVKWIEAFDPKKSEIEKLPQTKSAEVQMIQGAIVAMFDRIAHYTSELDEFNRLLDAKVRMRTEALTRTNTMLNKEIMQRKATEEALKAANEQLTALSRIDTLTGIANRRFFEETLNDRWMLSIRERKFLSIVICDIDHFKNVNDRHGHQAGDVVIKEVARTLQSEVKRATDLVARYGGEEFAFVLFDTDGDAAGRLIEKVRQKLASIRAFPPPAEQVGNVTLSFGICSTLPEPDQPAEACIAAADKALYAAKASGRNTLVSADTL